MVPHAASWSSGASESTWHLGRIGRFPRGGHRHGRHDCPPGLRRSCGVLGEALFSFRGVNEVEVARESDRRQLRDNQLQEVSLDQRAAHTAHLGTDPRGGRRSFGRPRRSASFQIGRSLENMVEDRSLRSDSRIVHALGGASPELRRPFARR